MVQKIPRAREPLLLELVVEDSLVLVAVPEVEVSLEELELDVLTSLSLSLYLPIYLCIYLCIYLSVPPNLHGNYTALLDPLNIEVVTHAYPNIPRK